MIYTGVTTQAIWNPGGSAADFDKLFYGQGIEDKTSLEKFLKVPKWSFAKLATIAQSLFEYSRTKRFRNPTDFTKASAVF